MKNVTYDKNAPTLFPRNFCKQDHHFGASICSILRGYDNSV